MIKQDRLVKEFIKLCKIDSVSKREAKIMKHLAKEFKKLGLKPTFDKAQKKFGGEVGNLFIEVPGSIKSAPKVLLNAHVDTVVPGRGVKPRIKKGVIYSDGTTILGADDKTGVVAIVEVIRALKENDIPHGDLQIVFTVAEEIGLCGSKALDQRKLDADLGFVLDGGRVHVIVNRAPSQNNIKATIIGKESHAGVHPEEGISSIQAASCAISKMKLGRIDKETTANIGIIKGGTARNIVPKEVELTGEARSHKFSKLRKQTQHMRKALRKACSKFKAKLKLNIKQLYRSFTVKKGKKPIEIAKNAAKIVGIKPKIAPTGGGSDANIFNAAGIPSVIIGVGARNLHTTREKVAIKDLVKGTSFLLQIILEAAQWKALKKKR